MAFFGSDKCREAKIAAGQFLPLNCSATALTAGAIFERKVKAFLMAERQFGRHFKRAIWVRIIARQKLPRDNGESRFCRETRRCLAGPSRNLKRLK